ncbi:MAG: MarR family transcriptional regulator [Coriobacteriales bacterium]
MQRSDREQFEQYVIGAISILSNRFSRFADSLHSDITFKQWYLMMMISRMDDEPKNVRDIAEYTGTTRQNVKKMLASLEEKGYVTCSRSRADGRALDIELTRKAHAYFAENGAAAERKIDELFASVSDAELKTIVASIQKLTDCLDALEDEA